MTTIPIGAPAPAIDQGAPGAASSTGCGDVFLALVQSILDAEQGRTQPAAPQVAEPSAGEAVPAQPEEQRTDVADPMLTVVPPPSMLAALAAGLPTLVALPPVVSPGADAAAPTGTPADSTAVSGVTAETVPSQATTTTPVVTIPDARDLRAQVAPSPAAPAALPTGATEDETAATSTPLPAASAPAASVAPAPSAPAPGVAPLAAPTAAAPVGTPAAAPVSPVAHQVFPEIVRLTTSTEGPQRVTIRLNPEALGEVRVVLTERRGTLEVSLSGGNEARRALLEGTPELQRLLDAVGRGDSRIVVRDATGLPVTAPSPASTTTSSSSGQAGTSWSGDLAGGAQTGAGRSGADTAPGQDRRHAPGTSSTADAIASATTRSRTTETVTGARPGLDVTM